VKSGTQGLEQGQLMKRGTPQAENETESEKVRTAGAVLVCAARTGQVICKKEKSKE